MDVVNLHVASELEDESQDSSGRGEAGAVRRSVAAHAANVGIGAEIQQLTRDLNKTITVLLRVIMNLKQKETFANKALLIQKKKLY